MKTLEIALVCGLSLVMDGVQRVDAQNYVTTSNNVSVVLPAFPPRGLELVNISGSLAPTGEGDFSLYKLPAKKTLIITDVYFSGSNTNNVQLIESLGTTKSIRLQMPFLSFNHVRSEHISNVQGLGIPFRPGSEVMIHCANGGYTGSYTLIGYQF